MTLQTENSICLIPCCFPAFKPCIGAQQPRAPGTEPGSVPWQSPDAWVTGSSLPAAATAHSSSQPGAALGIPEVRAPTTASRDPAAEESMRHLGCSAEEHPPSSFLPEGKFPASHHQSASSIMFPLITFSFTSSVKSVYNQRQDNTAQGGVPWRGVSVPARSTAVGRGCPGTPTAEQAWECGSTH